MNLLAMGDATEVVDEALSLTALQPQNMSVPNQLRFVLQGERDRDSDLEPSGPEELEQPERRPSPRAKPRDEDVTVQDDAHTRTVSHAIPPLKQAN
jgi:hypothetical protein